MSTGGTVIKGDIEKMDNYFKKNRLIRIDNSGWRRLSKKGKERLKKLQQTLLREFQFFGNIFLGRMIIQMIYLIIQS